MYPLIIQSRLHGLVAKTVIPFTGLVDPCYTKMSVLLATQKNPLFQFQQSFFRLRYYQAHSEGPKHVLEYVAADTSFVPPIY
ncbi:hypothetical protein BpHYR1_054660 [Brachionus plicatilis]|uniref:Uncharacterized protein n=1 Tax=Brachionus plicatilis TaxID=10195 RepID=A0A3M7PY35_BRAPC|nr:hypothetical protein BpHYR1_054660 [Brachionus plicatilis]